MATSGENNTFEEQTPLFTEGETNIGGNKKIERFARSILTTCIQFYTLEYFRKNFCPMNKFGKCVLVLIKLSILAFFLGVNGAAASSNIIDFSVLTQSNNTTAANQELTLGKIIVADIKNSLVSSISFISLIFLYFSPAIMKEFELKSTFIFDKKKFGLFVIVPMIMLVGAMLDVSYLLAYLATSVSQSIIFLAILTPIITIYFFLWHTSLYVMCIIIYSVCDQLYYDTLSEIEEAKKFILNKNNINERENWKESPLPKYLQLSNRVADAAKPFRKIASSNIILAFIMLAVISTNIAKHITVEDKRLGDVPYIYWVLFLFFHHSFNVFIMIGSISNLNKTLTLYTDTILSDIEVQNVLIHTNEKTFHYFSQIREEIQMISSSKVRFTINLFGDLSSAVLNSIFLLVIPLTISGMFTA